MLQGYSNTCYLCQPRQVLLSSDSQRVSYPTKRRKETHHSKAVHFNGVKDWPHFSRHKLSHKPTGCSSNFSRELMVSITIMPLHLEFYSKIISGCKIQLGLNNKFHLCIWRSLCPSRQRLTCLGCIPHQLLSTDISLHIYLQSDWISILP